jgi:hypothetical protein
MTNPAQSDCNAVRRYPERSFLTIPLLLIVGLIIGSSGCVGPTVISADRELHRLKSNQTFHPEFDGWFVPDSLWLDINDALGDKLDE